jgi:hypothetical protein
MPERRPDSRDSIKWSSSSAASWVGRPAKSELKRLEFIGKGAVFGVVEEEVR